MKSTGSSTIGAAGFVAAADGGAFDCAALGCGGSVEFVLGLVGNCTGFGTCDCVGGGVFTSAALGNVAASSEIETGCDAEFAGPDGAAEADGVAGPFVEGAIGCGTGLVRAAFNGMPAGTFGGGLFDVGSGGAAGRRISKLDWPGVVVRDDELFDVPPTFDVPPLSGVVGVPELGARNRAVVPFAESS